MGDLITITSQISIELMVFTTKHVRLQTVCGDSVFGLCFVMYYLVNLLVLQSSWHGRES